MNKKIASEISISLIVLVSLVFGYLIWRNGQGEEFYDASDIEKSIDELSVKRETEICVEAGKDADEFKVGRYVGPKKCCEGTKKIPADSLENETCLKKSDYSSICSACGNGTCEGWENRCNCKEDCLEPMDISGWKSYNNSEIGLEFKYPEKLQLTEDKGKVSIAHSIPFNNNGDCDMVGDGKKREKLEDFNVSFEIVSEKIVPEFIDGEANFNELRGNWIYDGVEGCGYYVYYFDISENATLIVKKAAVQALSGLSNLWDSEKILQTPGVISKDESEGIFNNILSTLNVLK